MAWKIIRGLFVGLFIGMISAVALYILGFCVELLNCACNIVTCNCNGTSAIPFMWSWESFRNIIFVTSAAGTVIGAVYGIIEGLQERSQRLAALRREQEALALKHRQENVKQLKQETAAQYDTIKTIIKSVHSYEAKMNYQNITDFDSAYEVLKNSYSHNAELKHMVESIDN